MREDWLVVQLGIAHRKISHGGRFAKEKGEKATFKVNNISALWKSAFAIWHRAQHNHSYVTTYKRLNFVNAILKGLINFVQIFASWSTYRFEAGFPKRMRLRRRYPFSLISSCQDAIFFIWASEIASPNLTLEQQKHNRQRERQVLGPRA